MTARRAAPPLAAGLLLLLLSAPLRAQEPLSGSLALEGAGVWTRTDSAGAGGSMRGPAFHAAGRVAWSWFRLGADLLEGRLAAPSGGARGPSRPRCS